MPERAYDSTWRGLVDELEPMLEQVWKNEAKKVATAITALRYFIQLWKAIQAEYERQNRSSLMYTHRRARNAADNYGSGVYCTSYRDLNASQLMS